MTRLIIHIGMHKTGSTTVQRFFSRNRWLLRRLGILYPVTQGAGGAREPKHGAIFSAISHEADHDRPHPVIGPARSAIDGVVRQIEAHRPRWAILSAEGFSGERPVFAEALAPLAGRYDCRVVCLLRRQDLWVESFYKQMVVSREVRESRPISGFLKDPATRAHLDYRSILRWWADAFGAAAIRVGTFEPERVEPRPLDDFARLAGLPAWLSRLPFSAGHANPSASAEAVEAVRIANLRGIDLPRGAAAEIDRTLAAKTRPLLSLSDRQRIMADADAGNREIARRWLGSRELFGSAPCEAESRAETWAGFGDPALADELIGRARR